jgi:hypothetical protein
MPPTPPTPTPLPVTPLNFVCFLTPVNLRSFAAAPTRAPRRSPLLPAVHRRNTAGRYQTAHGSYGGLYSDEAQQGRMFTVVQVTNQNTARLSTQIVLSFETWSS